MQASGLVQVLQDDLAVAYSHRDELAGKLEILEGPEGPLSRLRDLESSLQQVRRGTTVLVCRKSETSAKLLVLLCTA